MIEDPRTWANLGEPENDPLEDLPVLHPGLDLDLTEEPVEQGALSEQVPVANLLSSLRLEDIVAQIDREVAATSMPETMAAAAAQKAAAEETQKYILFSLSGAKYGMPLSQVLEISRVPKLMPLPHVPDWLLGVTNLRGDIISVIDLHSFLGLSQETRHESGRMCVVRADRQELVTGLMVDRVDGLALLKSDKINSTTSRLEGNIAQHMHGITEHEGQLLRILNLDSLLLSLDLGA